MPIKNLSISFLFLLLFSNFGASQIKVIDDIKLNKHYDLSVYEDNNIALLYTSKKQAGNASFNLLKLDHQLNIVENNPIILGGNYRLTASLTNQAATLSIFYEKDLVRNIYMVSKGGNTFMLHSDSYFYNTRRFKTIIRAGENHETFYIIKQVKNNNTFMLSKLHLTEGLLWETRLMGRKKNGSDVRVEDGFHLGNKIVIVQGDNAYSRKVNFSMEFFNTSNGEKSHSIPLNNDDIVKSVDLIKIDQLNNRMLMAGRYQPGNRLKQQQTISFYLSEYDLNGALIHEKISFGNEIDNYLVGWQDAIFDEDGNIKLLGERFTNTSDAEKIGMSILTAAITGGAFSAYTGTFKVREIILIDFNQELDIIETNVIPFQKTTMVNAHTDEYRTLEFARRVGMFRYRGVLDNQLAIFAIGDAFAMVDLNTATVNPAWFKAPDNTEFLSFLKDWKYPVQWDEEGAVFYKKTDRNVLSFEYKYYKDLPRMNVEMRP